MNKCTRPRNIEQLPAILTLPEAAVLLGICARTLQNHAREGTFPASFICDSWRVTKEDLMNWYDSNKKGRQPDES